MDEFNLLEAQISDPDGEWTQETAGEARALIKAVRILGVRNADLRERLAEAEAARDRDEARITVLEAALGGAISDLDSHDCQNVGEFEAVLGDLKAGSGQ